MELLVENQTLIIIIGITIILIAIFSFISRQKRKKEENEMNNYQSFSNISKTKSSKTTNRDKSQYKFSLETGENLDNTGEDHSITSTNKISEAEIISEIKKSLANTDLSEDQKRKVIEKYRLSLSNKSEVTNITLEDKIKIIETSKLSDDQKMKLIKLLKNNSNS